MLIKEDTVQGRVYKEFAENNILLSVEEIFTSLQGEGRNVGMLTSFVRLNGCNCSCLYCDTGYSEEDRIKSNRPSSTLHIDELLEEIFKLGNTNICITGGEPLLPARADKVHVLCDRLHALGHTVEVETNGTVPLIPSNLVKSFRYIMDVKTPSSGQEDKNVLENIERLNYEDDIVFVISGSEDFKYALNIIELHKIHSNIYFSACFNKQGQSNAKNIYSAMMINKDNPLLRRVRLQVQQHKIIGIK